jgi:hypothetical protein
MNNIKTQLTQTSNQRVVLFQLICLVMLLFNTIITCSNSSKISKVNKKQIIGIQLADGQVVNAQTTKVNDRTDETIYSFVEKWMYLSFNWLASDPEVEVEKVKSKVPGNVYASTLGITTNNDFRNSYIQEFSELIGKATQNQGLIQSAINIDYISPKPTKIKDGVWEVTVLSTWIGLDPTSGKEVFQIPVNKKLRLKAIPIAGKPTFQTPENNSQLQTIVNEINQYGLQIISIESYDPQ